MGLRETLPNAKAGTERTTPPAAPVCPEHLTDPLAQRIEWTPLKSGGTNFRTHKLVEVGAHQVRFQITGWATAFCLLFIAMGGGLAVGAVFACIEANASDDGEWFAPIFMGIMGLIFAFAGLAMLLSMRRPACFDRSCHLFWKGKEDISAVLPAELDAREDLIRLDHVHAVQILRELCTSTSSKGQRSHYWSYELNLVLDDGRRVNVVDHGNLPKLQEDASLLARFLDRPLWDATEGSV